MCACQKGKKGVNKGEKNKPLQPEKVATVGVRIAAKEAPVSVPTPAQSEVAISDQNTGP